MNYIITKPENIVIKIQGNDIEISLEKFIIDTILNDPSWGTSLDLVYMAMDIRDCISKNTDGPWVLPSSTYKKLVEITKKPSKGYIIGSVITIRSFFDAILEAKEEK